MIKVTVKGEDFKPFDIEIKELNLNDREELNTILYKMFNNEKGMFGPALDVIRFATDMTDEQINEFSNEQIFQVAIDISNIVNKKKLQK
tara:strand:+ start:184 stop:450 length:267 start_codon:yes stop_codon:yes gene_type:complete